MLMKLQYERPRLKGQPSPLNLFIAIVGLTYQVRILTLSSAVFKQSIFQEAHLP